MSLLSKSENLMIVPALINACLLDAMIDTGANANFISMDALRHAFGSRQALEMIVAHRSLVTIANGTTMSGRGRVMLTLEIQSRTFDIQAVVLDGLNFELVLGLNFCKKHQVVLDTGENTIKFGEPAPSTIKFKDAIRIQPYHQINYIASVSVKNCVILVTKNVPFTEDTGVYLSNGIYPVSKRGKCRLRLANLTDQVVSIRPETVFANFMIFKEDEWEQPEEINSFLSSLFNEEPQGESAETPMDTETEAPEPNTEKEAPRPDVDWDRMLTGTGCRTRRRKRLRNCCGDSPISSLWI